MYSLFQHDYSILLCIVLYIIIYHYILSYITTYYVIHYISLLSVYVCALFCRRASLCRITCLKHVLFTFIAVCSVCV